MSDIRRYTDHEIADAHTRFRMAIKGQQVNVVEYVTASDHDADLAQLTRERDEARASWRCFHCDEVFTDRSEAELHFGETQYAEPYCQVVDPKELREMARELDEYRREDTDLHKQLRSMEANHVTALRREEEKGYAKGIQDMRAELAADLALHREALDWALSEADAFLNSPPHLAAILDASRKRVCG